MVKCVKNVFVAAMAVSAIFVIAGCASKPSVAPTAVPDLVDMFDANMSATMEFPAVKATASAYQESKGLVAANAIDGDLNTTWTAEGSQWIIIDLGAVKKVAYVEVAMLKGSQRKYKVMFEASVDGTTYKTILKKTTSSGKTEEMEKYDTVNVDAQYIKIDVDGADSSDWNNIREVKVYGIK
jgi:hypothetical protein